MEKLITPHQAAKLLNVWPHTLRRWEKEGKLKLAEDMIAIVTNFSARIYGKRGGRVAKKLTELIEQEVATGENHG